MDKLLEKCLTDFNPQMVIELKQSTEDLLQQRYEQKDWLESFIRDMKVQEVSVNSAKTIGAVGSVVSAGLLFTPFALLGKKTPYLAFNNITCNKIHSVAE